MESQMTQVIELLYVITSGISIIVGGIIFIMFYLILERTR